MSFCFVFVFEDVSKLAETYCSIGSHKRSPHLRFFSQLFHFQLYITVPHPPYSNFSALLRVTLVSAEATTSCGLQPSCNIYQSSPSVVFFFSATYSTTHISLHCATGLASLKSKISSSHFVLQICSHCHLLWYSCLSTF